jgi:hypothetical protein
VRTVFTIQALVRISSAAVRIMRLRYRRLLSCFLLVTFTGISLLGEGLHWLTPEDEHHHHQHGLCICSRHSHGASRDDHDVDFACHSHECANRAVCESVLPASQVVISENDSDAHVCKICAYLFQIVSEAIDLSAPLEWQPLVVFVPNLRTFILSSSAVHSHAPRGPPVSA